MGEHRSRAARVPLTPDVTMFAISSIDRVRDIAQAIIDSRDHAAKTSPGAAKPFCRNLCSALDGVKTQIQRPKQSHDQPQLEKVKSLLKNLERLCNWPRSSLQTQANPWPTLTALRYIRSSDNAKKCIFQLAVDPQQKDYRVNVIRKLKNYSATTWKQEAAEVAQNDDASATCPAPHKSHDLDEDIKSLYTILSQYRCCQDGRSSNEIVTNLRLNGYRNLAAGGAPGEFLVENASAEFGVLFLDHPHKNQGFWQEASIQTCPTIPPTDPKVPSIQVTDEDSVLGLLGRSTEHDYISFEDFCEHISHRDQDLLRLSTRNDRLVYHRPGNVSREWLAHREAVSLSSLFAKPDLYLLDKPKAILAMLAAQATWQFYDSDLLGQGLTSESVQFVCEKRSGITGAFVNEPMLLAHYRKKDGTSSGDGNSTNHATKPGTETIHDMPRILALGILLLELETRKPMKKHRENPRLCPPGRFGINTDYKIACKLIATGPDASESIIPDMEPLSPLRKVLPLCITPGSLESKIRENLSARGLATTASKVNTQNALRSAIYSELVHPLENWVKRYENFDGIKPLYDNRIKPLYEVPDSPTGPRPERPPFQPQTASQTNITADVTRDNKLREDSRKWFERYMELRDILQPRSSDQGLPYRAVKIAILDTGIRQGLYDSFKDPPGALVYEDFVDTAGPDKNITSDDTGHGSSAVLLVEKMCPSVTYYVARVLKRNVATRRDVDMIVKGIDWAISQKVDIITMAIGFKEEQGPVVQAVDRAHKQGILIFSAASNERRLNDVYCPANLTDKVFGIFATDAGICQSRSLNPDPLPVSFAIFGEGVHVEEGDRIRHGTSYSTSVAAGLAAALLDFSRQVQVMDPGSILARLGSRPHMQRVFCEMAKNDNRYLCLQPWSLLKKDGRPVSLESQRDWISGTIERVLQPNQLYQGRWH